jgi:hypothetical protein
MRAPEIYRGSVNTSINAAEAHIPPPPLPRPKSTARVHRTATRHTETQSNISPRGSTGRAMSAELPVKAMLSLSVAPVVRLRERKRGAEVKAAPYPNMSAPPYNSPFVNPSVRDDVTSPPLLGVFDKSAESVPGISKISRFRYGVATAEGRKIVAERTEELTQRAKNGAEVARSSKYASTNWSQGVNAYMGSRMALQRDKDYLVQVAEKARKDTNRTDLSAAQRQFCSEQIKWSYDRISSIDNALLNTAAPGNHGLRDPDLIHPGDKVALGFQASEPHIVTKTEAKLAILEEAKQNASRVGYDDSYINDPLRALAKKDAISYAVIRLQRNHTGDVEWIDAITESAPTARSQYTQVKVKDALDHGDVREALDTLRTNLDATASPSERKLLLQAAGKHYFTPQMISVSLDRSIERGSEGSWNDLTHIGPAKEDVTRWLTDYSNAPPEIAMIASKLVLDRIQQPDGALDRKLREDGYSYSQGTMYAGLSGLTQRADEHGGHASSNIAKALIHNVYNDASRNYSIPYPMIEGMTQNSGLIDGVTLSTRDGCASLSVAIINQLDPEPAVGSNINSNTHSLRSAFAQGLATGVKNFNDRITANADAYAVANKEELSLRSNYGLAVGAHRVKQAVMHDHIQNPDKANAADAKYERVQQDGVAAQRLLDSLGVLKQDAVNKQLLEELALLGKDDGAAKFALSAASGLNANGHPADLYYAPLLNNLRNQILFGLSADVNNRTPDNQKYLQQHPVSGGATTSQKLPNQNKTTLQALSIQSTISLQTLGLYSVSGEALINANAFKWLVTAHQLKNKPIAEGDAGTEMRKRLDRIDVHRFGRLAQFLHADKNAAFAALDASKAYLPEYAKNLQSGNTVAAVDALSRFIKNYPDLGFGDVDVDPNMERRAGIILLARGALLLFAGLSSGVDSARSFKQVSDATDDASALEAKKNAISSLAFAASLTLLASDNGAKGLKRLMAVDGGTEGFVQRMIAASTQHLVLGSEAQKEIFEIRRLASQLHQVPVGTQLSDQTRNRLLKSNILTGREMVALHDSGKLTQPVLDKLEVARDMTHKNMRALASHGPMDEGVVEKLVGMGFVAEKDAKLLTTTGKLLSPKAGYTLSSVARVMPGGLIDAAVLYALWNSFDTQIRTDPAERDWWPTALTAGVGASIMGSWVTAGVERYAQRQVSLAVLHGATLAAARFTVIDQLSAVFGFWFGAANLVFTGAYVAYSVHKTKSAMEADHNPRYTSMVKDVTGLSPEQVEPFMNQSGGAFDSPSPLPGPLWLKSTGGIGSVYGVTAKIVTGGVQPMDVLNQWAQNRPGKEGAIQAYLPTQSPDKLQTLAQIAGDVANHYIPRGSSQVSQEGLVKLESRMKQEGLWSPVLDRNDRVDDMPAPEEEVHSYQPEQPVVKYATVKQGDNLWDLYGGRSGLDRAYERGLLPSFDPRLEDGKF